MLALAASGLAGASDRSPSSRRLVPDVTIEQTLATGEVARFHAELRAGESWLVRVEQRGVDVVLAVDPPHGDRRIAVDSPTGREGTEVVLVTPPVGGRYGFEVRAEQRGAPEGRFAIRLERLPTVLPIDLQRRRAWQTSSDAGERYREAGNVVEPAVVAKARQVLEMWRAIGDRTQEAWTLFLLGRFADQGEDVSNAVDRYGEALAVWRQLEDPSGLAATLDRLGIAQRKRGALAAAIASLEEALFLRTGLGHRVRQAETRNHLCLTLQRSGRFEDAGACYESALGLARTLSDRELEADVLNNLGGIFQNLGEPQKTLAYFRQALALRRSLGDTLGVAMTTHNLGFYHCSLGEIETGLLDYDRALAIFEQLDNRAWQARTLNNLGFAYLGLGAPEHARSYLQRALPLRRATANRSGEAVTLRNLGRAAAAIGDRTQARAYVAQALEISQAIGDRRGMVTARKLLGDLRLAQGDVAAARDHLEGALGSVRSMGNRREEGEILELLSRARLAEDEPVDAAVLANQALTLHHGVGNPAGQIAARVSLARAARAQGQLIVASEGLEAALGTFEALQGRLGEPRQRAALLASHRRVYEEWVDVLMERHRRAPDAGHDRMALEISERGRSRALLALLQNAGVGGGRAGTEAVAERRQAAERRLRAKTSRQLRVLSRTHTEQQAEHAAQERHAALGALQAVRTEIRRQRMSDYPRRTGETLDTRALQDLLDGETVFLVFLLGETSSVLWLVTSDAVQTFMLPPRSAIETLATAVHEQVRAVHRRDASTRQALDIVVARYDQRPLELEHERAGRHECHDVVALFDPGLERDRGFLGRLGDGGNVALLELRHAAAAWVDDFGLDAVLGEDVAGGASPDAGIVVVRRNRSHTAPPCGPCAGAHRCLRAPGRRRRGWSNVLA